MLTEEDMTPADPEPDSGLYQPWHEAGFMKARQQPGLWEPGSGGFL